KTAYFEQMRDRRKNEILTAAKEMFLSEGIAGFSIQQLAKNLDLSTVTLYKYFKNMDDIMRELEEQIIEGLMEKLYLLQANLADKPLDSFMQQMHGFYDVVLSERKNISLLILFQVFMREDYKNTSAADKIEIYSDKWKENMRLLLGKMKAVDDVSADVDIDNAILFIEQINVALVQHIGLLSDRQYQAEEKTIQKHIEQTLQVSLLYLKTTLKNVERL
ncbi:MAG: TetR/AcrR family transcriptional regulator, partial [Lachnospiraceae bacterium]|nr:TetR/AcrR family transcriptional regulator [Lachnospiraceae bacterium]